MTEFNRFQQIKREFFSFRNGLLADTLRRGGSPFKIIFGLNLPQIKEVASHYLPDKELATLLWENISTRESRLIAPMLYPVDEMDKATAVSWINDISTPEVADVAVHSLLKRLPYSKELIPELMASENVWNRYIALRIMWSFLGDDTEMIEELVKKEISYQNSVTLRVAMQLLDEIDFLKEQHH